MEERLRELMEESGILATLKGIKDNGGDPMEIMKMVLKACRIEALNGRLFEE